jgi:hypothetical protein
MPGGGDWSFQAAVSYREAVVRLSLGMVATAAGVCPCLDEAIIGTARDADLNILFRIVMHCQIMDDILDYREDLSAGLPGFLTATMSLPEAWELTRSAALAYANDRDLPRKDAAFPLRLALFLVSTLTRLAIVLGRWRQTTQLGQSFTEPGTLLGRPSEPSRPGAGPIAKPGNATPCPVID